MPTLITVRRNFVVPALLEIEDAEFAHWYGLGVWWAMFGESQGTGPYPDTYVIDTIQNGITNGWYADPHSGWFAHVCFYLGMLNGGFLVSPSETLVVLTDPDFTKGYYVGRDYCFTEAVQEGRVLSDTLFNQAGHEWALGYRTWQEPHETLAYVLGCRVGELSGAVLPLRADELTLEGTVHMAAVRLSSRSSVQVYRKGLTMLLEKDVRPCKRAVIYCRVSTDKQEIDGESLEYQEDKCCRYAELHDIDIVIVLHEAKSGYIHYTLRDKLTFARQLIRDHMADMIIVFDLRRFSRNFVHSAMIFEEIESNGGEIVSVSENIDNSLTGKLVRSILAWSAESEREKIVEYANRHWQTRLAQSLPMATGRAPYGWEWADKDKTRYLVNKEEAMVRLSIFTLFVEQDMSVRSIAHKLTEDGILPPAKARGWRVKSAAWQPSTVHAILVGSENIGILTICKTKVVMSPNGKIARQPNVNIKTIPGGIPAIIPGELYELAQYKLKHNQVDKSRLHLKPEDFLLKSHIFCKTCGYRMGGRYRVYDGVAVGYYRCCKENNRYDACPDRTDIKADKVNELVWADCSWVFEEIEAIRDTIRAQIEQDVKSFLENTQGKQQLAQLTQDIAMAEVERDKHTPGSYYYNLVSQDIQAKQQQLRKYEEESKHAEVSEQLLDIYQRSVLSFLDFLSVMKGRYHEASFKEKRNALDVLGVMVTVSAVTEESPAITHVETDKEWLSLVEAWELTGIDPKILSYRAYKGEFTTTKRDESRRCTYVHRDELNRWLPGFKRKPRSVRDDAAARMEITYSPIFTGVQSPLM